MSEGELLSIPSAARELGVSHMTIRRWIDAGLLAAEKPGREYVIQRTALEPFHKKENRPKIGRPKSD